MLPHFDMEKITKNSITFFLGGIESSASHISSTLFFLLSNPDTLRLACQEVRSSFRELNEMTIESTENLVYLKACMTESFRLFLPAAAGFPRQVPEGGATVCGRYVAGNTVVSVFQWAMYHSERNFLHPDHFKPERWLGEPSKFESKALHPFSFGPRACIAQE